MCSPEQVPIRDQVRAAQADPRPVVTNVAAKQRLATPSATLAKCVKGTREIVVHPDYVMVYLISGKTISIHCVLHAAQQWP